MKLKTYTSAELAALTPHCFIDRSHFHVVSTIGRCIAFLPAPGTDERDAGGPRGAHFRREFICGLREAEHAAFEVVNPDGSRLVTQAALDAADLAFAAEDKIASEGWRFVPYLGLKHRSDP